MYQEFRQRPIYIHRHIHIHIYTFFFPCYVRQTETEKLTPSHSLILEGQPLLIVWCIYLHVSLLLLLLSHFSRVRLCVTPWTAAYQAPPSMGFSRQDNESIRSDQIRSVAQSCPTLCDPMNRSTPGLPVLYQLPEFTQTHIHRVSDPIQPSHPLSSPSPPAPNPSQHQSLFQ